MSSFYTFKKHHGLFYRHARRYLHTVWKDGRRVEENAIEYVRVKCRKETLELFRSLGIMAELESGLIDSARIVFLRVRGIYVADYKLVSGARRKTLYYLSNNQCRKARKPKRRAA